MGDVLRTTSVLPALREEHPACFITWITRREAVELIANNPLLDELLVLESGALGQMLVPENLTWFWGSICRGTAGPCALWPMLQINAGSASTLPVRFSR